MQRAASENPRARVAHRLMLICLECARKTEKYVESVSEVRESLAEALRSAKPPMRATLAKVCADVAEATLVHIHCLLPAIRDAIAPLRSADDSLLVLAAPPQDDDLEEEASAQRATEVNLSSQHS